jgi:hypothetical protein
VVRPSSSRSEVTLSPKTTSVKGELRPRSAPCRLTHHFAQECSSRVEGPHPRRRPHQASRSSNRCAERRLLAVSSPRYASASFSGHGVQSGVQIEQNRAQLRATQTRSSPPNPTRRSWIVPAGGRAVAGSNPVSPTRTSCRQQRNRLRRIGAGSVAGSKFCANPAFSGLHLEAVFAAPATARFLGPRPLFGPRREVEPPTIATPPGMTLARRDHCPSSRSPRS